MASLALHLKSHHHKPSQFLLKSTSSNLTFSLLFSSSSSSDNNNNGGGNPPDKPHPFSSYFDGIKSKLKHHEQQREQEQQSLGFKYSNIGANPQGSLNPKNAASFDEIKKNLSEFRRRSTVPPLGFEQQQKQTMFQTGNAGNPNDNAGKNRGNLSFDSIRESLRKMKGTVGVDGSNTSAKMSLNNYKQSLKLQPIMSGSGGGSGGVGGFGKVIGGSSENLPMEVFGKEMKEKEMNSGEAGDEKGDHESGFELYKMYTHDELGNKLRELRPEVKGKNKDGEEESWFSISELGERLKKLKKDEEAAEKQSPTYFRELRESLSSLHNSSKDNRLKNAPIQSLGLLSPSNFTEYPPQEHLVEKYFHPDNMSAEEKLKLELKKVRDEFKMHESDCGSTRVQIAQLTTEILHLSAVLHKKDKHSRRGLQAKVQQRKKLLKYLRRTDWESYCFVLSKLGLRDNPDYKN
ncbi:uncharacterized protein LOC110698593 [Chenopodium quinoa]|uniref:Small ribosomal subunit protein uS15c n=1 Tax=Chenopodium quinoa TaxID=63459 RepID=A0A803LE44_CHEQI|nr:uncharacterized protein LOC110698593 [Chenopodium quinoa]XP_021731746.1 uncharacterized protein LOC110698593 [Chenopodium quinoa]